MGQQNTVAIRGGQVPHGSLRVSGAKNSATRLMSAALLTTQPVTLTNFPTDLVDVREKARFLESLGVEIRIDEATDRLEMTARQVTVEEGAALQCPVRTTYLLAAGQLLRHPTARIPYPGGCRIGSRKYDLHLYVWRQFGCVCTEREDCIQIERRGPMRPAEISFPITTVGGTENALLCASIIEGASVLRNAYITPEIIDLITMLRAMGVDIELQGTSCIIVRGKRDLRGVNFRVMPDRIEAVTWIVYGLLSRGDILVRDVPLSIMEIPLIHLKAAGADLFCSSKDVYACPFCVDSHGLQPFEVATGTHPGVISDMQPFYVLLALGANGRSKIVDYRYPDRTAYLDELNKFCGNAITYRPGEIIVNGPVRFRCARARSTDLRGSMAVLMAGLLAEEGISEIEDPQMALRGYNKLIEKLHQLGIAI